jgi:flagellar assembly protein FliH
VKWSSTIACRRPLRDVSLAGVAGRPALDSGRQDREREGQAYARGVEEGERRLHEQLLQQRNELMELQTGVLQGLRQAALQVARDAESALIDYAFEVAQKLVAEIPINRELIEANLRSALAQAEESTEFFIQMHPDDLALLRRHGSDLLSDATRQARMHFIATPEVGRGGCLVRTEFGLIDARRETRLDLLRQTRTP